MVAASRKIAALSLWDVRSPVFLMLFFFGVALSPTLSQEVEQSILRPPVSSASKSENPDFEGKIITRIAFDPAAQPLPQQEIDRRIPLHPGSALHSSDVRKALEALYATGRYHNISVDAEPDGEGVALRIVTELNFFVSGVDISGESEPPNRDQLAAATKLELGSPFSDSMVSQAVQNIQERLRANGLYQAQVDYRVVRNPDTEEASIFFDIDAGSRAHFNGVNLSGNLTRSPESVIRSTGWHRRLGPLPLPGWRELTETRLLNGISRVQDSFQKGSHLQASVALEQLNYDKQTNQVTPDLRIDAGPILEVNLNGAKVSGGKMRELIPIFQERSVDRSLLLEGQQNLAEYFQSLGYFQTQVKFDQKQPQPGRSVIDYNIARGSRSKLVNIGISGNRYFDNATLRERLSITPASFFRYHWGRFSPELLEQDKNEIISLYRANGFRQADVMSMIDNNYKGKRGQISVLLDVQEGPQWFVDKLEIEGVSAPDEKYLRSILQSTQGEPFSEANVATDRDAILGFYFNNGYPDATFDWSETPGATPTRVNLRYTIHPGERQYVRSVLVRGLETTNSALVANRISLAPGDPISQNRIAESQQRLYDLGIFSKVQTAIQNPEGDEDQKYVLFHLDEARKYSLTTGFGAELARIGGGVTTFDAPAGTTGFSPRVSLGLSRLNFLGVGHTVGIQTLASTLEQRAGLNYLAQQFTGNERLSLTFSGLFDHSRDVRTFTAQRLEGSAQLAQRISRADTIQYRYVYHRVIIPEETLKISPELIPLLSQPDRAGLVGLSFIQDRRDDPVNSHRGVYNTIDTSFAWSGFGSETDFTRILIRNANYYQISRDVVLARSLQFGYIQRLGGLPEIPLAERFFSGGADSNRAFPENQAGPRDLETGFPLGGNALLFHSTELRFPLIGDNVGGVLFHDMGNVYSDIDHISFRFHQKNNQDFDYMVHSVGFGIRYRTPIGPLRVDFSVSPNSPSFVGFSGTRDQLLAGQGTPNVPQRINIFQFHFSLGQTF